MLDKAKSVLQVYVVLFESKETKMALENMVIHYWKYSYLMGRCSCKFNGDRENQALKEKCIAYICSKLIQKVPIL